MGVSTVLLTVEDFRKLPEDSGPTYHELHQGRLVAVTRPKHLHFLIQRRIRQLLEPSAPAGAIVDTEFAFRPLPEHEVRVADVAYVSPLRAQSIDLEDYLAGAPDIVVEVLSPSNVATELFAKEQLCLQNGTREFWVVDPSLRHVRVTTPDGHSVTFHSGQRIPLPLALGATLAVDSIFPETLP